MLHVKDSLGGSIFAGTKETCGNCGSFIKIPGELPYVEHQSDKFGASAELIECPQCCTSWAIESSNTREAELTLNVLQNEHRRGRANHLREYRAGVDTGELDSCPMIDSVTRTLEAIAAAERAHAEAVAIALRTYTVRELEAATGIKRATLQRRGKAGSVHALPEVDLDEVIGF